MPKVSELPAKLRPYAFHGLELKHKAGEENAVADCPWCGKEGKFAVNVATGVWRCFVCGEGSAKGGGNALTFLRTLHARSAEKTNGQSKVLAKERKLLHEDTLLHWQVVDSILTREWLVPGWTADGKLSQLYRYAKLFGKGDKRALLATSEMEHQLHGVNLYDPSKGTVFLCEGPWDAMALWEIMRGAKMGRHGPEATGNELGSLLADVNIFAVPGCQVFSDRWLPLFADKRVVLLYDSDHPKETPKGKRVPPAGMVGAKRVANLLAGAESPPKQIEWLEWGADGGFDPALPSGFDVRDWLTAGGGATLPGRLANLGTLLEKIKPIPDGWVAGRTDAAKRDGGTELSLLPCESWRDLTNAWAVPMNWTEGLDTALACMLASILSVRQLGDPLWLKVLGPASCGKSTLCEALSTCREFTYANSTMTGFYSGWKTDSDGEEDHGLMAKIKNKTLITKDGDTILKSPARMSILSQARDLYDCVSRTHFGNGISREYNGHRITWLLCGTEALREIDGSELGQRFLDVIISMGVDEDVERETNLRILHRTLRTIHQESGEKSEDQQDEDMTHVKRLTGGYVEFLRRNASRLLTGLSMSDADIARLSEWATFVSYMRARPSEDDEKTASREYSTRLTGQLARLALCLAAVMNRRTVDADVMAKVRKVTLDTSRGRTLEICRRLNMHRTDGWSISAMAMSVGQTDAEVRRDMQFLRKLGAVQDFKRQFANGKISAQLLWRLTPRMEAMWKAVDADA